MRWTIAILFVMMCFSGALADEKAATHPFSVHDMLAMERISEPGVSPDGRWVVFTLRKTDLEADKGRTDLWLVGAGGEGLRPLTTHPESDSGARWLGDSETVLFVSGRSGSSQVWRIRIDGGEAQQITDEPLDVSNLVVSGDGAYIGFTMEVYPGKTPAETKSALDEIKERKTSGKIYDRVFIRHWDTWKDGRRSHLFVMPVDGGEAVDVMKDMDADTPSKPFGGSEEFAFTPDSKGIVFSARDAGRQEAWSTNFDLYYVRTDGSQPPMNITADNKAWDTSPVFSPGNEMMAYLAMERAGYESDRFRIVVMNGATGERRILAANWDRSPSSICFSTDGKTIFATAGNLGQKSLFAIDVETGKVSVVVKDGKISSPSVATERIVFAMSNLKWPDEIYSVNPDGGDLRYITRINADRVAAARTGDYEQFTFKGWSDETVYCYIVKPVDFDPAKKYPVAFLIHGGPQGSFGNSFHYRWNPQAYAGAGYACV
ncbi:MAG: S9 family peptidase, partial [Planctomycetes bacterium]|nr:S9 family peptidase [Planctomycetota bacterium]